MTAYKSFSATATGISHTNHDKGCEDCSYHYDNENMSIAIVADGHGSEDCFRSAKGAEFAVDCAKSGICALIGQLNSQKIIPQKADFDNYFRNLINNIITEWHGKVKDDYTSAHFTDEELADVSDKYKKRFASGGSMHHAYGTTLIAVAVTEDFWFGFHIGDGRLTALYKDGSFDQPVPWDLRCFLNRTTSICDDDTAESTRFYYCPKTEKDLPLAVFLCSDGLDDNYAVDEKENAYSLFNIYRTITQTFAEDGFESTCSQIEDLAHSFATKGKGDDTSIAGIIDLEAANMMAGIYANQISEEQGTSVQSSVDKNFVVEKTEIETHLSQSEDRKKTTAKILNELNYGQFTNGGNNKKNG
jgi:serine/threonine protein phosphatase PrpC